MNNDNLITVRNYAKIKNVTTQHIYSLMKSGKVKSHSIDGVKFVILENETPKEPAKVTSINKPNRQQPKKP
jgi:hypothetical protein